MPDSQKHAMPNQNKLQKAFETEFQVSAYHVQCWSNYHSSYCMPILILLNSWLHSSHGFELYNHNCRFQNDHDPKPINLSTPTHLHNWHIQCMRYIPTWMIHDQDHLNFKSKKGMYMKQERLFKFAQNQYSRFWLEGLFRTISNITSTKLCDKLTNAQTKNWSLNNQLYKT